jgi:hypothetical protein
VSDTTTIADRQREIVEALQGYVLKMIEDGVDSLSVQSAVNSLDTAIVRLDSVRRGSDLRLTQDEVPAVVEALERQIDVAKSVKRDSQAITLRRVLVRLADDE